FTRAARTRQKDELAFLHGQGEILQRVQTAAIEFREMARLDHAACAPVANVLFVRLDAKHYSTQRLRLPRLVALELKADMAEPGIYIHGEWHSTGIVAQPNRRRGLLGVFDAPLEARRHANRSHVLFTNSNRFSTVDGYVQHHIAPGLVDRKPV